MPLHHVFTDTGSIIGDLQTCVCMVTVASMQVACAWWQYASLHAHDGSLVACITEVIISQPMPVMDIDRHQQTMGDLCM